MQTRYTIDPFFRRLFLVAIFVVSDDACHHAVFVCIYFGVFV